LSFATGEDGVDQFNQPELWHDLYFMLGGASAALVGLLFVVMSLHFHAIKDHPDYNMHATVHAARNNTYHMLTVLVSSALILVPQPQALLGAELAVIHFYGLRLPVFFTYRHFIQHHAGFQLRIVVTIAIAYSLGIAGGIGLILHAPWSMYRVTVSCIVLMVRTVLTAWGLMFDRQHPAGQQRTS
jgi:hypothetical protein